MIHSRKSKVGDARFEDISEHASENDFTDEPSSALYGKNSASDMSKVEFISAFEGVAGMDDAEGSQASAEFGITA